MNFSEWLVMQMNQNDLSQADLARAAGLSRAAISNYINDPNRKPDIEAIAGIAKALKLAPWVVFMAAIEQELAGNSKTIAEEIAHYKIGELETPQIDEVLKYIEFIQDRDDKAHRREFIERHTREGETPPEVVNKK